MKVWLLKYNISKIWLGHLKSHPLRAQNMNAVFTDFPLKRVIVTVTQSTGFKRPLQKCLAYYNKVDFFQARTLIFVPWL